MCSNLHEHNELYANDVENRSICISSRPPVLLHRYCRRLFRVYGFYMLSFVPSTFWGLGYSLNMLGIPTLWPFCSKVRHSWSKSSALHISSVFDDRLVCFLYLGIWFCSVSLLLYLTSFWSICIFKMNCSYMILIFISSFQLKSLQSMVLILPMHEHEENDENNTVNFENL